MRFSSTLSLVAALPAALMPSLALASGLFVARFGGEHGHATERVVGHGVVLAGDGDGARGLPLGPGLALPLPRVLEIAATK